MYAYDIKRISMRQNNFIRCFLFSFLFNFSHRNLLIKNKRIFSGHRLRYRLFVYRLIVATLIGNIFNDQFLKIELKFRLKGTPMCSWALKG